MSNHARTAEIQQEALAHARNGQALTNYPAIYQGFLDKGIPESEIQPRVNVFTFNAWKALGRSVRKGEHGVKVLTFVPVSKTDDATGEVKSWRRPWSTTVFHISQTRKIGEPETVLAREVSANRRMPEHVPDHPSAIWRDCDPQDDGAILYGGKWIKKEAPCEVIPPTADLGIFGGAL